MRVTAWASVSDLVDVRKSFIERLIHMVLRGEKARTYSTKSLEEIFSRLKKSGVDGIELLVSYHTSSGQIKEIQKISNTYGLPILSIHQSLHSFTNIRIDEIQRLCDIAQTFSVKVIVLHSNAVGERLFDPTFIKQLEKLQKQYRLTFGIENMPKSLFSVQKPYTWRGEAFTNAVKYTNLGITFDTTHLGQVGEDICDFYTKHKAKIIDIHLSDFRTHWLNSRLLLQSGTHLALGEGELPIKKFLGLLKATGYKGVITMEIDSNLDGLCRSAEMIKRYT